MKRMTEITSIIFIISGLLLVSCSKQDTEPIAKGAAEKATSYTEKAGKAMESAKETVSGYTEKAQEAASSYTEKAGDAMESAKDTASEYGDI